MLNEVRLIGNVGKDPEIRRTQDGRPIANLRIATSESWTDRHTGERRERTEWHQVVVFSEGLAKICETYIKKGMQVYIAGSLQTRKWQDQSGQDRFSTEVVLKGPRDFIKMLGRKPASGDSVRDERPQSDAAAEGYGDADPGPTSASAGKYNADEIPF
jgi:single-strand DNA-binding protein